jgi:hypothetical protein
MDDELGQRREELGDVAAFTGNTRPTTVVDLVTKL